MKALLYKEWIKLRYYWLAILGANALFCAYFFLNLRHQFQIEHAEMLYYQANRIGRLFYGDFRYVPLLGGLALGVAQFAPEVVRGRFRLSMHLPIDLTKLVLAHLAIGLIGLGTVLALDLSVLALSIGTYFPAAFVTSALTTALPWMLAGVAGYLGTALVLLEPIRRYQLSYLVPVAGVIWLCNASTRYGAYDQALWGLVLAVGLLGPTVLVAAFRFRDGGR